MGNEHGNEAADATATAAAAGRRSMTTYETQRYDEVARETYEEYRGNSPPGQQGVHDQRAHGIRVPASNPAYNSAIRRGDG